MSTWERSFADLFKRHHEKPGESFSYTKEDALCALSVVWRVLAHTRLHPEMNHLTFGSDYKRTDQAFECWRQVLTGHAPNPRNFRMYWIWFDYVMNGPDSINRYIFHACDFDVWASKSESYSVVHIPGLFLIGVIEGHRRADFRGAEVSFQGARYNAHENKRAPVWLQDYISQKMVARQEAIDGLSPIQQQKIAQTVLSDPERAMRSPLFRTIQYDMGMHSD